MRYSAVRRLLIYRLGSIGDTVVALPCLNLLARAFPNAERRLLTNFPVSQNATGMDDTIGGSGLVHGYLRYRIGTRDIPSLLKLRKSIAAWSPDAMVYLAEPRSYFSVIRDALFFHICGVHRQIGVPFLVSQQNPREIYGKRLFESEAHRLARCIRSIGEVNIDDPDSWNLHLSDMERTRALQELTNWSGRNLFISVAMGTKVSINHWGLKNWRQLLERTSSSHPDCGLVLIGSSKDRRPSDAAAAGWTGPKLNLCGEISPRISAAVMEDSLLFIGHDSGPMHLAAAVNVPCVAIFSARNKPGEWFPPGPNHSIFYKQTSCYGCRREYCTDRGKACINSITVDEVFEEISSLLHANGKTLCECRLNPVTMRRFGHPAA